MQPKLFDVQEAQKKKKDNENLYVVSVFFNPQQSKARDSHLTEFIPYIKYSGAELFLVEIVFGNADFKFTKPHDPMSLRLRTETELWHKERGLNLGIQKLIEHIPDCKYIATIDADIVHSNSRWVKDTVNALQRFCVVQTFSEAQNLNPKGERQWSCPSVLKQYHNIGYHQHPAISLSQIGNGHPGLSWAWRRETLEQLGGLIDICTAGSGDTHMANALCEEPDFNYRDKMSAGFKKSLVLWAERCNLYVKGNVGYVDGVCMHKWHGRPSERGYSARWDIVCFHQYDPATDLVTCLNGLYRFSHHKPKLASDIRRSLNSRNDDGTDE